MSGGRVKPRWHDEPVARNLGDATAAASASGGLPTASDVPPALRGQRPGGATRGSGSASCWSRRPSWWAPGCSRPPTTRCRSGRRPPTSAPASGSRPTTWSRSGCGSPTTALSAGYFTVDDELPADLELTRSVAAGELLPRGAVGTPAATGLVEVPVAVEPELVPPTVAPGDVVDVYVVAPITADTDGQAQAPPPDGPALTGATVVDAPELASSFGTSGKRQLVLAVPEADAPAFFALLARYDAPRSPWSGADEGRPAARRRRRLGDPGARPAQRPPRPGGPQALRRRRRPARHGLVRPGRHRCGRPRGAGVRPRRGRPPRSSTASGRSPCVGDEPARVRATRIGVRARSSATNLAALPEAITTDHQPAPEPPPTPDDPAASRGG